jgi:hypothetical protein
MSGPLDVCPGIHVNGELRLLGLTKHSMTTSLPRYAQAGPNWTLEQILQVITDTSWTPAVEVFGDSWVKDQDGRGACAGYAAASALERARAKRGLAYVELSGDGAYAAVNDGRDAGSGLEENMVNIRDNGIPPASEVPRWEFRKSKIPAKAYQEAKRFRGFECFAVRTEIELASALAAGFVTVVAVHAGNGGRSPDGLVDWSNGVGNHSVVVDDIRYRQNTLEFQTANSWGLRWGERGRGWLRWKNHFSNPIRYHMFYAIRSTIDDSESDNPPEPKEA